MGETGVFANSLLEDSVGASYVVVGVSGYSSETPVADDFAAGIISGADFVVPLCSVEVVYMDASMVVYTESAQTYAPEVRAIIKQVTTAGTYPALKAASAVDGSGSSKALIGILPPSTPLVTTFNTYLESMSGYSGYSGVMTASITELPLENKSYNIPGAYIYGNIPYAIQQVRVLRE